MWDWISKLNELRDTGETFAMATVSRCTGSTPCEVGAKVIVCKSGRFYGTVGGGQLEKQVIENSLELISGQESKLLKYPLGAKLGQCCGGTVEVFIEVLNRGPLLYLFGAGHVGQEVCQVLSGTPFGIHVIDDREEWVQSEKIPSTVSRTRAEWKEVKNELTWDPVRTFAVVMTYRHDTDQEIIEGLIEKPIRYIGLIGSRAKWARFQKRMEFKGISKEKILRVKCPIGISFGGKSPREVAISLASEILAVYYGKPIFAVSAASPSRREVESDGNAQRFNVLQGKTLVPESDREI